MKGKDYVIFSQKMAGFMMWNGCRLLKIKPDIKDPTRFVYFFPNNDYVLHQVNEYKRKIKKPS